MNAIKEEIVKYKFEFKEKGSLFAIKKVCTLYEKLIKTEREYVDEYKSFMKKVFVFINKEIEVIERESWEINDYDYMMNNITDKSQEIDFQINKLKQIQKLVNFINGKTHFNYNDYDDKIDEVIWQYRALRKIK